MKLTSILKLPPSVILSASKRRIFLFKERNLRFRGFSKGRQQGVNLVGYLRAEMGLGQAARGIATALETAGIPFNVVNFESGNYARHGDMSWAHKEVATSDYDITILVINPDNIFNARSLLPKELFENRYVIGYWFWELPDLPYDWKHALSLVNELWAGSNFIRDNFARQAQIPVVRIPPVVDVKDTNGSSRQHFDLPENAFLFLAMCDTASVFERKNPLGAIAAFQSAFGPNDKSVGLVMKISGPTQSPLNRDLIKERIGIYQNIWIIDRLLSPSELNSLLTVCDCGLSLHRAEGFGLVPAEMMSLGKPVIATGWSGNADYMTADNSATIKYELVKLERDYGPYEAGQVWAEPDIEHAAEWMKRLKQEPHMAQQLGAKGQEMMRENFSAETAGRFIKERLSCLRLQNGVKSN